MSREELQAELNYHPDNSPFWDTPQGQEVLHEANRAGLEAENTNRERCALYAEKMRAISREL